jgi:hypothetical protein
MNAHPANGTDLPPTFTTAAECRTWLETAPLTDTAQMMAMFLRELRAQNRAALAANERLDILELLRGHIYETQEAFSRKFVGKLQPLAAAEQAAFETSAALWHALVSGYMRCAEACFANDALMKPRAALVMQRALATLVAGQIETHRVSRNPTNEHWRFTKFRMRRISASCAARRKRPTSKRCCWAPRTCTNTASARSAGPPAGPAVGRRRCAWSPSRPN